MADNRIEIIDAQASFLEAPISSETSTVHKWRRLLIADLLRQFQRKLSRDGSVLQRLRAERESLREELSEVFRRLKVSEKSEKKARMSLGTVEEDLKSAQELAKERLDAEIAARESEIEEQIRKFNVSQEKYEAQIAEYEEKVKAMETQNNSLKMISTQAVKYITSPVNRAGFFYFLQRKGIVMDIATFDKYMDDLNNMTADQLLLSFESGFLGLLDASELHGEKEEDIPPLPTAEVVFPVPILEVNKEEDK